VHEKSLIEGECELNYQKAKREKDFSTIFTQKNRNFLLLLIWTFDNNITKSYYMNLLSLTLETMQDIFI